MFKNVLTKRDETLLSLDTQILFRFLKKIPFSHFKWKLFRIIFQLPGDQIYLRKSAGHF